MKNEILKGKTFHSKGVSQKASSVNLSLERSVLDQIVRFSFALVKPLHDVVSHKEHQQRACIVLKVHQIRYSAEVILYGLKNQSKTENTRMGGPVTGYLS